MFRMLLEHDEVLAYNRIRATPSGGQLGDVKVPSVCFLQIVLQAGQTRAVPVGTPTMLQ